MHLCFGFGLDNGAKYLNPLTSNKTPINGLNTFYRNYMALYYQIFSSNYNSLHPV